MAFVLELIEECHGELIDMPLSRSSDSRALFSSLNFAPEQYPLSKDKKERGLKVLFGIFQAHTNCSCSEFINKKLSDQAGCWLMPDDNLFPSSRRNCQLVIEAGEYTCKGMVEGRCSTSYQSGNQSESYPGE